ncbi:MAG: PilZ domain-containing protein [Magnetococcales bacterium]|nr:PilZ domain-containing protein [Magnetococcales bacterium]
MKSRSSGMAFQSGAAAPRTGRSRQPSNQRRHQRYGMQFPVVITFDDGEIVKGFSEDVSLTGFFVVMSPGSVAYEERCGKGTIQLGKDQYTFQCRVTRQISTGIGVLLTKDCAILGYAITNYVFNQLSSVHLGS